MPTTGGSTRRTAYGTITNTVLNLIDANSAASKPVTMPAEIRGFSIYNPNPDTVWLKIFSNPAASVTIGTDAPDEVYEIPAGSGLANGAGLAVRPSREARPYKVHSITASYAITTQREAGGTAAATACEGTIEFACASVDQQGNQL